MLKMGMIVQNVAYLLNVEGCNAFDKLADLKNSLSENIKMVLLYIAGYITRNDEKDNEDDTTIYYQKYGRLMKNCGGLNIPTDSLCQWSIFCCIMFTFVKDVTCRRSLSNIFILISDAQL